MLKVKIRDGASYDASIGAFVCKCFPYWCCHGQQSTLLNVQWMDWYMKVSMSAIAVKFLIYLYEICK